MANWKRAVTESAICGKTHPDTVEIKSDIDLLKMQFAEGELPQVKAIEVYHDGNLCFGYELFYKNNVQVGHHIGGHVHADVRCERFELESDEYLVGVGGRCGDICDQLNFTTSKGRKLLAGGKGGEEMQCQTQGAQKPIIVAMGIGLGGHVHNFKCWFIDLAQHSDLATQVQQA